MATKPIFILMMIAVIAIACGPRTKSVTQTGNTSTMNDNVFQFKMNSIDGKEISLASYKGKKILIVNTASECGFTPQYEGLQKLHESHGEKVQILGFPANNFGAQEPGSNTQIAEFCKKNYGVSFQMFEKISVAGEDQHPLYQWLSKSSGQTPNWNFCKYLIDENGKVLKYYSSRVKPEEIVADL